MKRFAQIFKNNLERYIRRGQYDAAFKMGDDIGDILKGHFSATPIDPVTKKKIGPPSAFHNDVTNLSKSTVIRLISQGVSSYVGQVVPANLRISKIRLGNAPVADWNSADDKKLAYYDPSEKSSRYNNTAPPLVAPFYCGAGGGNAVIPAEAGTSVSTDILVSTFGGAWAVGNTIEIDITDPGLFPLIVGTRPPSHKTFKVNIKDSGNVTLETLQYTTVYSRNSAGSTGTHTLIPANPILDPAATILVYNYTQQKWKLVLKLTASLVNLLSSANKVNIQFEVGKYNIINSIVPKSGQNAGFGNQNVRCTSFDYYSITAGGDLYSDSGVGDFVDDFSVTMNTTMNGTEGNGIMGPTSPVVYTEAFLCTEADDVFSITRRNPPPPYGPNTAPLGFVKDSSSAFLLSWTMSAVL